MKFEGREHHPYIWHITSCALLLADDMLLQALDWMASTFEFFYIVIRE